MGITFYNSLHSSILEVMHFVICFTDSMLVLYDAPKEKKKKKVSVPDNYTNSGSLFLGHVFKNWFNLMTKE